MKKMMIFRKTTILFFTTSLVFDSLISFAQWQQTGGPYGGSVNCFLVNNTTILAGTPYGVYLSDDNGSTWKTAATGISNKNVKAFTISGTSIFAGTASDGVYMSLDNGIGWISISGNIGDTKITSLAVNGTNLFAGTETGGIFFTSNNGASWSAVNTGLADHNVTSIATTGVGTTVFAGTDSSGVFLSLNNGVSWTSIKNGLNDTSVTTLYISGSNIYAGTFTGLYVSTNNGNLWTSAGVNQYITSVVRSGATIFASGLFGSVYRSTNGGGGWGSANAGLPQTKDILSVVFSGTVVCVGTKGDGTFFSLNNGTNWSAANSGLTNTNVTALAVSSTTVLAGTELSGFFYSANSGSSWTSANTSLTTGGINALAVNGGNIFAGTNDKAYLSTDAASTWSAITSGLTSSAVYSFGISGSDIFAATSYGVFLSSNNGASWTTRSNGLGPAYPAIMSAMAVSTNTIFVGTGGFGATDPSAEKGVFRTADNGANWSAANTVLTNKNIYAFAVNGINLYAGTAGGVFLSTNGGTSWTALNSGLSATTVYSLMMSGANLIAGTDNGVFLLGGTQWSTVSSGLPANTSVYSLTADATYMYAGTKGVGIWKRLLSEITGCTNPSCLVWPGDANNDLTANHYDILPIGVYYGQTGTSRDVADNVWAAHYAADWGTLQTNGNDIKFADCDGDGTIGASDTIAIRSNYGSIHAKTEETQHANAGDPDLYFVTTYSVYAPGATIDAELWAGTSATNEKKLYGLGFDIAYDKSLIQNGASITYSSSLIGSGTLSMTKLDDPGGKVYGAITRTTHIGVNGYGKIATVKLKVISSLATVTTLTLSINKYQAIDSSGTDITLNTVKSSILVGPLGIKTVVEPELQIYPNPSTGKFFIQANEALSGAEIKIYDVLGKKVYDQQLTGMNSKEVDLSAQPRGIYLVSLIGRNNFRAVSRIIVE